MTDFKTMQNIRQLRDKAKKNDTDKMTIFIKGFCSDKHNPKPETLRALGYARKKHQGQTRDNGEPYIVHPLSMACFAIGLGLTDDNLLAVILLHDICEDTGTAVNDLPSNEIVKHGVKYMTVQKLPSDGNKAETKRRYYWSLLEDKNALICKALDRYSNLNAMLGVFESERIIKNIRETHNLLLPVLKEAREIYPEYNNEIHVLRNILRDLTDNLAIGFGVDLYSET
ncbi:HD domain-containing protein [Candidatus Saccharibacteria bacterium]|nr:HD domain-containing protein [Candidatus Saccharibacteria bacterium]